MPQLQEFSDWLLIVFSYTAEEKSILKIFNWLKPQFCLLEMKYAWNKIKKNVMLWQCKDFNNFLLTLILLWLVFATRIESDHAIWTGSLLLADQL